MAKKKDKTPLSEQFLMEQYIYNRLTINEISKLSGGWDQRTIIKRLKYFDLFMKPFNGKDIFTKEILYNEYINNNLTIDDIAILYKCSPTTVCNWLKLFDIIKHKNRCKPKQCDNKLTPEFLRRKYLVEKLSIREIGELVGCGSQPVRRKMKEYNIKKQSIFETHPESQRWWYYKLNIDIDPNNITSGSHVSVYWRGDCGHVWKMVVKDRILGKQGCPYCCGARVLVGFNDLKTTHWELCEQWSSKNLFGPETVSKGSNKDVIWRNVYCGHEWVSPVCARTNVAIGCPVCNKSQLEQYVIKILEEKNIKYKQQKTFDKCKNKKLLQFDFYLPYHNYCIECQGKQHYEECAKFDKTKGSFEQRKKRDKIKYNFCKKNDIKLLYIRYDEIGMVRDIFKNELGI